MHFLRQKILRQKISCPDTAEISLATPRKDRDITGRALNLLGWNGFIPHDQIEIEVEHGWITLTGTVDWQCQKEWAAHALRQLPGVAGITNHIDVKRRSMTFYLKRRIEEAFVANFH